MTQNWRSARQWLWLTLAVIVLDQASKWAILSTMYPYESHDFLPWLNFTLVFNRGAAFSFLSESNGWQRWLFTAIAVAICTFLFVWLGRTKEHEKYLRVGFVLILGGAIGNLIDRVFYGYVIDFIDFHLGNWHWYTFNIADIAITLGVIALLLDSLVTRRKTHNFHQFSTAELVGHVREFEDEDNSLYSERTAQPIRAEDFRGSAVESSRDLKAAQQNIANEGHKKLGVRVPDNQDEFPSEQIAKASNLSEGPQQRAEAHPVTGKSARFSNSDENTAPLPDSPRGEKELQNRYTPSPGNRPGSPQRKVTPDFKPPGM